MKKFVASCLRHKTLIAIYFHEERTYTGFKAENFVGPIQGCNLKALLVYLFGNFFLRFAHIWYTLFYTVGKQEKKIITFLTTISYTFSSRLCPILYILSLLLLLYIFSCVMYSTLKVVKVDRYPSRQSVSMYIFYEPCNDANIEVAEIYFYNIIFFHIVCTQSQN